MSEQSERMEITSTALLAELLEYAGHAGWCYTNNDAGCEAEGGDAPHSAAKGGAA
jgi:hypothetical protein